jgi:hypothetical protein
VDSLAEKIVGAIVAHENNPAVEWISVTRIRVVPSRVEELKSGFKETVAGRRKRFVAALEARLSSLGWRRVQGRLVYELSPIGDG